MKIIYHDPNKSTQKLVIKPGEAFCPRLDTTPEEMMVMGFTGSRKKKRGRPKKKTMVGVLKRGAGNWL